MKTKIFILIAAVATLLTGCVGRTGKVGTPISTRYQTQLASLKLDESTPDDLKNIFAPIKIPISLKEAKMDGDKKVEIWQVARGGNMDAAALLLWGYVSYDKDQEILFRFENDKLISYESVVIPDPPPTAVSTTSGKKN